MPDTKITALTAISTVDPAVDVLPIVDVSDTTMAASGTTKKITSNQILGAGGTATLASATITGDLTVDTNTLYVNSAANRVLIGTLSALGSATLSIAGKTQADTAVAGDVIGNFNNSSATGYGFRVGGGSGSGNYSLSVNDYAGSEFYKIAGNGVATWSNVGGVAGTAMTLNSTGLGVGVTPAYKIHASQLVCASDPTQNGSAGRIYGAFLNAVGEPGLDLRRWDGGGGNNHGTTFIQTNLVGDTLFYNGLQASNTRATSLKMTLDASGRLLVGPTSANASGGILQLSSGITFPATQVASSDANTLDDYEEGTFTPIMLGTVDAGTGTYGSQVGRYTKIGNLVTVSVYLDWTARTATGSMRLGGLPFATNATANTISSVAFGYMNTVSLTASNVLTGFTSAGNTFVDLYQTPTGGGVSTVVPVDTSAAIAYNVSYRV